MNILPKKRWHVRTKANIERVRRDEANAAEEEKELKRRIQLAEQEARTDYLRKKARGGAEPTEKPDDFIAEHVNFFRDLEENKHLIGKNKEHEEEEKAKKEKFEKNLGILTYLGQSSLEAKGETPWYLKSNTKELITGSDGKDETASANQKLKIDPLTEMKKYLALKEKSSVDVSKPVKEKDTKKHKPETTDKKLSKVEELRAKRIKRELEERNRSQKFLETLRKGPSAQEEVILDDRLRKYNSQFNPHLARNNLEKEQRFK